ncbi:AAA family ATPase [Thiohalorhabdus sp. Cl-TMA]|uniref:AAA family ATPase n=1 Tax=Thiohalorhabdus methylotrophus TaxID=3242694 RepID=A0ABV4TY06_9GAMM
MHEENVLADWHARATALEEQVNAVMVDQSHAVHLMLVAIFARGHALLEGDVGVGKTTLLRALARGLGGGYERLEGTVDLMPSDMVYHTYVNESGQPCVEPGPLLRHGQGLATFFFNEINRARPQMHSLLLRLMAERSMAAFNREYHFPHLLVFADRNRVEREETFELPAAARDRFFMEINVTMPEAREARRALMADPRFHDTDRLIEEVEPGIVDYTALNDLATTLQHRITVSEALQDYALDLWEAVRAPAYHGIHLDDVDTETLVAGGGSPRGMSMMIRAARVHAWLADRAMVVPEDIRAVFLETAGHRIFFNPVYELRRDEIIGRLIGAALERVAAP